MALRADDLVAELGRLGVGRVDDRLDARVGGDAEVLGDAGRATGPDHVRCP